MIHVVTSEIPILSLTSRGVDASKHIPVFQSESDLGPVCLLVNEDLNGSDFLLV
ncbi:hypothetical protein HanRHA438_Chr11g0480571 [Helianthus annuus]|nr:hypothetical protein HanRHA438_Chr11g0480571 [Helianthus annuus]